MEELMKELNDMEKHKIDNIQIVDETKCQECEELQKPPEPTEPMAEPGSVRGDLVTPEETFTPEEQVKIDRRNYITRVKTIALATLNFKPLTNPRDLSKKDFKKLLDTCRHIIDNQTDEWITKEFNDIVCTEILSVDNDITRYPIYSNKIYS